MTSSAYAVLGLDATATLEEVRRAFMALALKWHPDKNPSDEAASKFHAISEAFQDITRPPASAERHSKEDEPEAQESREGHSGRKQDDVIRIGVSLKDVRDGCLKNVSFEQPVPCVQCSGLRQQNRAKDCICSTCFDEGIVYRPRHYAVQIPAGVEHGHTIILKRRGAYQGPESGHADVKLLIEHAFEKGVTLDVRTGSIYATVRVTLEEILCGFERQISLSHLAPQVIHMKTHAYTNPSAPMVFPRMGLHEGAATIVRLSVIYPEDASQRLVKYRPVLQRLFGQPKETYR